MTSWHDTMVDRPETYGAVFLLANWDHMHRTLHRDILWLGRQWAVTGLGIQAIDQKLDMQFDVPISHICEEGLTESMVAEDWFDIEEFADAEGRQTTFGGTPADISVGRGQGRLTGLATTQSTFFPIDNGIMAE
jgi:hypothetical protein